MDAVGLRKIIEKHEGLKTVQVVARDEYRYCTPGKYIVNNQCIGELGEHWVAINTQNCDPEFFDAMGQPPVLYGFKDVFKYNRERLQNINSNLCWAYCLYFLLKRDSGMSYDCILKTFSDSMRNNDNVVKQFL